MQQNVCITQQDFSQEDFSQEDWQLLKQDAQDFINNINLNDMSNLDYAMLGASVAIIDHVDGRGEKVQTMLQKTSAEPTSAARGVFKEFKTALEKYNESRTAADRDQMREALKTRLDGIERELVEVRHEVHDPVSVKMFVEFRENVRLKL